MGDLHIMLYLIFFNEDVDILHLVSCIGFILYLD